MIRWGIIGAGNIAKRFARGLSYEKDSILYGISGRNLEKLSAFQTLFPCDKIYLNHDELIADPNVDIVYISLPNKFHKEFAIKALKAHKAVLCEKPAMVNVKEMEEVIQVAQEEKTFFMEAMKSRFTPMYQWLKNEIQNGLIGKLTQIDCTYCSQINVPKESHYQDPVNGGCLRDVGIYCVNWYDDYFEQPLKVIHCDSIVQEGLDVYVNCQLNVGKVECAFDREKTNQVVLKGSLGEVVVTNLHRPEKIEVLLKGQVGYTVEKKYLHDDFYTQIHHVVTCYQHQQKESPIMSLENSLHLQKILEIIRQEL